MKTRKDVRYMSRVTNCPNCGAPLKGRKCEYCGTVLRESNDGNILRVETYQNPVQVYQSRMQMDDDIVRHLGEKESSKYLIHNLSRNLADAIAENMEMYTEHDIRQMRHIVTARVRIVRPDYLF